MRRANSVVGIGLVVALCGTASMASVIYVKAGAGGSNNGTSWANAYTRLDTALAACTSGDEIWVAAGTYTPDDCAGGCAYWLSFELVDGCDVLGGFAGSETCAAERDPATNVTILSGDNAGNDPTKTDNALNVVFADSSVNAGTLLDGFTITAGYADSYWGGGVRFYGADAAGARLIIEGNHADEEGGGMDIYGGSPTFDRCIIRDNDAVELGGGLYISGGATTTFTNCLFEGNAVTGSAPVGIGGAGFIVSGTHTLTNCTIADNTASNHTGGIYVDSFGPTVTLKNCILWGNGTGSESANLNVGGGTVTVTYTDWQGHTGGTGNINSNPSFTASYGLNFGSPCKNAGSNAAVTTYYDLNGCCRKYVATVDMGAFEYGPCNQACCGDVAACGDPCGGGAGYRCCIFSCVEGDHCGGDIE